LQVWNLRRLCCIQKQHLKFPRNLPIICKTPEFGRKTIIVNSAYGRDTLTPFITQESQSHNLTKNVDFVQKDFLIVLYSNSYAKVDIIQDESSQLSIMNILYDECHLESTKKKRTQSNKNPKTQLTDIEEEEIANRLTTVADSILSLKHVDKEPEHLIDLTSKQIVRWDPTASSTNLYKPSSLFPIKKHGIYHKIPYFTIKDPECTVDYKPSPSGDSILKSI